MELNVLEMELILMKQLAGDLVQVAQPPQHVWLNYLNVRTFYFLCVVDYCKNWKNLSTVKGQRYEQR